jgi:hypothetical protein
MPKDHLGWRKEHYHAGKTLVHRNRLDHLLTRRSPVAHQDRSGFCRPAPSGIALKLANRSDVIKTYVRLGLM